MAWTKDLIDNPGRPLQPQVDALMLGIKNNLNVGHIGISVIMNTSAEAANSDLYYGRNAAFGIEPAVYAKRFTDSIHALGLKVLHRGTDAHFEGIYNMKKWAGADRYDAGDPNQVIAAPFNDEFERASIGGNYTQAADGGPGAGNVWTISNGELIGPASDGWRRTNLTNLVYKDVVAVTKVKKVGNQQLVIRANTDSNFPGYGFQLRTGEFRLERPGLAMLASVAKSLTENAYYWIKAEASGNTIRGKVWLDGDVEPSAWDISVTDATYPNAGRVGFSGESGFGHFDSLTITSTPVRNNWLGRVYNYISTNSGLFANGDIWAPFPEATGQGIFNDSSAFLPNTGAGVQANFGAFFQGVKQVSDAAFAAIGLTEVITGYSSQNWSEVNSGWLPNNVFIDYLCVDHYGTQGAGHSPTEMLNDLRAIKNMRGKPVFLQEWGDYWSTDPQYGFNRDQASHTAYLNSMYAAFQTLVDEGTLVGFNYWRVIGGAEQVMSDIDPTSGYDYELEYDGIPLQTFFAANVASPSLSPSASGSPSASTSPSASSSRSQSPSSSVSASTSPSSSTSPSASPSPSGGLPSSSQSPSSSISPSSSSSASKSPSASLSPSSSISSSESPSVSPSSSKSPSASVSPSLPLWTSQYKHQL